MFWHSCFVFILKTIRYIPVAKTNPRAVYVFGPLSKELNNATEQLQLELWLRLRPGLPNAPHLPLGKQPAPPPHVLSMPSLHPAPTRRHSWQRAAHPSSSCGVNGFTFISFVCCFCCCQVDTLLRTVFTTLLPPSTPITRWLAASLGQDFARLSFRPFFLFLHVACHNALLLFLLLLPALGYKLNERPVQKALRTILMGSKKIYRVGSYMGGQSMGSQLVAICYG